MDQGLIAHIDSNFERYIADLVSLVKIPSVSATGQGVVDCASHLSELMRRIGIDIEVFEVEGGHPIIVGQVAGENEEKVLLVYDHYDVQPVEPLELWDRDPFSGEIADGMIHGRGASDSKGNLVAYISAIQSLRDSNGLPITVKFLVDGDEEISSPPLERFVDAHKPLLSADAVVCADGDMDPSGKPMITLGMKGLLYVELKCRIGSADMHSSRAALVPSASWRLVKALETLRDLDGRIKIPGWMDGKLDPTEQDMELIGKIPFDEGAAKREMGVDEFLKDAHGVEALRDFLYEPTCNIAGLTAGYQGEGVKTVLPAEASAKLDMRLVYDQDPRRCLKLLREHLSSGGFPDIEVTPLGICEPSHTPADAPIARAAAAAAGDVYGTEPVIYPKHHASGPDYLFSKNLGLHSIWTGCPPAYGNIHAPNEFIGLEDFKLGIRYAAELIDRFANW